MKETIKKIIQEKVDRLEAQNILQHVLLETMANMKFEGAIASQIAEKQKGIQLNLEMNRDYVKRIQVLLNSQEETE